MKNFRSAYVLQALLALSFVSGCVSGNTPGEKFHSRMRVDPAPLSDFLPNQELLEQQPNHFPFHYYYQRGSLAGYKRIYIAPVDMSRLRECSSWAELDKAMMGQLNVKVEEFADFSQKAYRIAFKKAAEGAGRLEVVDRTDLPDTLILEASIVGLSPTKAELTAAGVALNFVVIGAHAIASTLSAGSVTVECRVRDAKTGEIVVLYADTEKDPKTLIPVAQLTWSYSTRINIKKIAYYTAMVFQAKDYHDVRREFPIGLISFVKDASLEEEEDVQKP